MSENFQSTPYMATDEEWAIVSTQFNNFCEWIASNICSALKMPRSNRDAIDDIVSELNIVLLKMIAHYKRQNYIAGAIRWFDKHPEMIPDHILHEVGYAMFCWRFRAHLGSIYGFSPVNDHYITEAMNHVIAPVDFRWEPNAECLAYMKQVKNSNIEKLNNKQRKVFSDSLSILENNGILSDNQKIEMNDMAPILSNMSTKPSKRRPFFLDKTFHVYVKRVLINWRNKYMTRRPRVDGVGYVDIDSLASIIPDMRSNSLNSFVKKSDIRYQQRRVDDDLKGFFYQEGEPVEDQFSLVSDE
jgi:hypothetical protein